MTSAQRPRILDIPFDRVSRREVVARVEDAISAKSFCHIVTPGPEFLMLSRRHPAFRKVLTSAELSLPDGIGIVFAARALGISGIRRVTGNDLLHDVCRAAQQKRWRVFFYGSHREGAVARAAARAVRRYPGITIAGAESGFRHWLKVPDAVVCWRIRRAKPDILFVALGAPEQELWIARNRHRLGRVTVAAGIGGALDYLAGAIPRAPALVRLFGLEWLVRLLMQPRRRWWRIVTAVILFPAAVIREKLSGGSHAR